MGKNQLGGNTEERGKGLVLILVKILQCMDTLFGAFDGTVCADIFASYVVFF